LRLFCSDGRLGPRQQGVEAIMIVLIRTVLFLVLVSATTTSLLAQENAAAPARQAPPGHRQPTADSVSRAAADRAAKTEPQSRGNGRDLGGELTICRGC